MKETKNKVIYINTNDLELLDRNPRYITKDNFNKLKKSIKENADYFEARPLIVSNRTGKNIVIAGNQRLLASRELKLEQVPCVILKNLTEEKEREIIIRDNVELGDWDYDILANDWEIEELEDWGVKIEEKKEEQEENIYTDKIEKQQEEKPTIDKLINTEKRDKLIEKINKLNTTEEEKQFLINCSQRFLEFNYRNIAEYYCHSSREIQDIMKELALIINNKNKNYDK